ncbi:bacillithiol biosynthesis deacetylase BshB1 [Parvicella tangerina]|uniref:N-acetyl-alpha-D-glucosaminyl L-malate deacetylase 1 n=1 Tax=Parvicella tangerina TaxID=2829795 RepID=A0A916JQ16_9FLAO|nr:bacillithiol biosynthesis deacetylase BshB1 [Parvicella tangerina]CAG5086316.1 N-acetyl-alpha-D-glucosaminyl L-malate deacetylase 1 [Parvicella tangerina]
MKLDILAFAAHPDDVELAASGTVIKHIKQGKKVGIIDLTRGELGTRGSGELRDEEAKESAEILQLSVRHNLDLGDGFFEINENTLKAIIRMIRLYQPTIILCNSLSDRHPDHGRAGDLVSRAAFLSGLRKIETIHLGENQHAHRPKAIYRYIQDYWIKPDIVIDISKEMNQKLESIQAFKSQFYDPSSDEPETPISSKDFMAFIDARARQFGRLINTTYGEGFNVERPLGVEDLTQLL